uniref:Defensin-like protein 2 n=3 Tax=Zea mays TaxID=4577 RepID=DEF2_MAIZE|nr:RecName: Full=Defensin-like protein 2; AltName: Full=Gamma-zeathionin-2 [Zea mays]
RVCMGKSQHHSFPCISDRLCSNECVKEDGGWTAGYCHLRYCRCQKAC